VLRTLRMTGDGGEILRLKSQNDGVGRRHPEGRARRVSGNTRFFASLRMTRTQILRLKPQNDGVGKASS